MHSGNSECGHKGGGDATRTVASLGMSIKKKKKYIVLKCHLFLFYTTTMNHFLIIL